MYTEQNLCRIHTRRSCLGGTSIRSGTILAPMNSAEMLTRERWCLETGCLQVVRVGILTRIEMSKKMYENFVNIVNGCLSYNGWKVTDEYRSSVSVCQELIEPRQDVSIKFRC